MKAILLLFILPFFSTLLFAQQKEDADNLVQEGVVLQDKGEVDSALSKYNLALKLDKDNLRLLRKSLTVFYP